MRAKHTFSQVQLRLQAAGCRYRLKQASRSPYIQVYDTQPPRRQQAARGFRMEDEQACWDLAELLLRAHERAAQGSTASIWEQLEESNGGGHTQPLLSWGEICGTVQGWIAPGGPKARDRNPFSCFKSAASNRAVTSGEILHPIRSPPAANWRSFTYIRPPRCSSGEKSQPIS